MFHGTPLPPSMFAVTAANASESSWGVYCPDMNFPEGDMVEGKHLGTCLGRKSFDDKDMLLFFWCVF